jgi:dethiobiotin synthetase
MPHGYFVTGTDTGVGKTLVACALLHAFAARGLRAVGMKPVAAGAHERNGVWVNGDVEQLIAASNVAAPRGAVNPYCFVPPIAPHLAAEEDQKLIKISYLMESYQLLSALADVVVVEGAGGFCVPLNAFETSADLAQQLALPVVLVVGLRLGCLNHALLTAEAIRARGLVLSGWVANALEPQMTRVDDNVSALQARMGAPMIARLAFLQSPGPSAPAAIASRLDLGALA